MTITLDEAYQDYADSLTSSANDLLTGEEKRAAVLRELWRVAAPIDSFASALREQDNSILHNIGITLQLQDLPSHTRYTELRSWIFAKPWQVYLKRLFQPRKYREYTREYIQVALALQQEFISAVMDD